MGSVLRAGGRKQRRSNPSRDPPASARPPQPLPRNVLWANQPLRLHGRG